MDLTTFFAIVIPCALICITVGYITDEVLEQRRRETRTGEFESDPQGE